MIEQGFGIPIGAERAALLRDHARVDGAEAGRSVQRESARSARLAQQAEAP